VLDALVYREDAAKAGVCQAAIAEQCLQAAKHPVAAVTVDPDFLHMIGRGQGDGGLINGFALVIEQEFGFIAQQIKNFFRWHV
jgi:hypothetical protein